MTETYSDQYVTDRLKAYVDSFVNGDAYSRVFVRPEGGWGEFYPRDGLRLMAMFRADPRGEDTAVLLEKVTKQLVKGRNVAFLMDDKPAGSMAIITAVEQDLNSDRLFIDQPILLQALTDAALAAVVEKFTPPKKDTVPE